MGHLGPPCICPDPQRPRHALTPCPVPTPPASLGAPFLLSRPDPFFGGAQQMEQETWALCLPLPLPLSGSALSICLAPWDPFPSLRMASSLLEVTAPSFPQDTSLDLNGPNPCPLPPSNSHRQLLWCLSLPGVRGRVGGRRQKKGEEREQGKGSRSSQRRTEGIRLEEGMDP